MTDGPQERARKLYEEELVGVAAAPYRAANIEMIWLALVEASQLELDKRRAVEQDLAKARQVIDGLHVYLSKLLCANAELHKKLGDTPEPLTL